MPTSTCCGLTLGSILLRASLSGSPLSHLKEHSDSFWALHGACGVLLTRAR
ncbi:MAG: hypothetical protein QOI10_3996 [Solirubrobacterales bacterium]|nr:hypothetical protein [Solirubrobacterales bacterium]